MKVLWWIGFASAMLFCTMAAEGSYEEDAMVPEGRWDGAFSKNPLPEMELIEAMDMTPPAKENPTPATPQEIGGKSAIKPPVLSCVQRKQEALKTLNNYRAAETLRTAAVAFAVADTVAPWRSQQWRKRYISAASNYAFFCEQSMGSNKRVSDAIHEKEGTEAKKAAIKGVQEATADYKEKQYKATHAAKEARKKALEKDKEDKTKKLVIALAKAAREKRLKSYPQADATDLLGFTKDALTGEPLAGVTVASVCPLQKHTTTSGPVKDGESNFKMPGGLVGPLGYRCDLLFTKPGYVDLKFDVELKKVETQGIFRHAVLMPTREQPAAYSVVLQYGTVPAHLDGHLQVLGVGAKEKYDITSGQGASVDFVYAQKSGDGTVTLDQNHHSGYGPVTHSIHVTKPGTYRYYVKNKDHHTVANKYFRHSKAKVFLYQGNQLVHEYNIRSAEGTPATLWEVFTMVCSSASKCQVTEKNNFQSAMTTTAHEFVGTATA